MTTNTKLLVVDDEEANRDMLARRLERSGFCVQTAESGAQALGRLGESEYDVVLLDSMMPGMSGLELLKLLRAVHSPDQLPVIMVTAVNDSNRIAEAIDLGANDYVTKPIDYPVAVARIRSQVARKRAESALRVSEERYALAARSANDGLWDWDLVTNRVYYSPRWKSTLGLEDREVGESPAEWLDRICEWERPAVDARLRAHLEGATPSFEHEYRIRHRDGTWRWMLARALAVRNEVGQPIRLAGSQSDVTGKKTTDTLTGLGNRTLLNDRLEMALSRFKRSGELAALLFIDLDRFKLVNDSMGHVAGDRLLVEVSGRIRDTVNGASLGHGATTVRMGGDEFAVFIPEVAREQDALQLAESVIRGLRPMHRIDDRNVFCSASIGVALLQPHHRTPDDVVRDADTAMYAAKATGKGRAVLFDRALRDRVTARLEIESDLRLAIEHQEFVVYYQPRVLLDSSRIRGFEALVRWKHPTRGIISPDEFIPIAEETGLIDELGFWVLRESCRQMKAWQDVYPPARAFEISVNVSPRQCREGCIVEQVKAALQESGLPAEALQLEITESLLLADMTQARRLLDSLKALGVGLKVDDFGTGYSCLRYLSQLPFDSLKIDRSFTFSLSEGDKDSEELVRTIVRMAQNLRLEAVAEGVENQDQIERLKLAGCEFGQGFFYSRPVDAEGAELLIRADIEGGMETE